MKYPHLVIFRAWWGNTTDEFGNFRYGLEYGDGKRPTFGLEKTIGAVEAAAHKLAADNKVTAELIDFAGQGAERAARVSGKGPVDQAEKMFKAVCCGGEMPAPTAFEPLVFSENVVALPTIGGIVSDLPLSAESEHRFPESVRLKVTVDLEMEIERKRNSRWVVVCCNGQGVAMTIKQAYERGLREERNWCPNLDSVPTVPGRRDFAAVGL